MTLSLTVASSNKVDLSGLSSDDSSFEENEQLLQQASKSTSKPTSQSKILRFASNLPSVSISKLSGTNLSCSDYVPDAVKININKQVNPSKQSTLEFKTLLSSTENTVDRPRRSLRLDATAATNVSAGSYDGKVDLKDSLTANCTLLDWPKIFASLAAEVSSSTVPAESFCHPRQGPFRVVESASGLVVVNRRDI
jgi:hypothetical protein